MSSIPSASKRRAQLGDITTTIKFNRSFHLLTQDLNQTRLDKVIKTFSEQSYPVHVKNLYRGPFPFLLRRFVLIVTYMPRLARPVSHSLPQPHA